MPAQDNRVNASGLIRIKILQLRLDVIPGCASRAHPGATPWARTSIEYRFWSSDQPQRAEGVANP